MGCKNSKEKLELYEINDLEYPSVMDIDFISIEDYKLTKLRQLCKNKRVILVVNVASN